MMQRYLKNKAVCPPGCLCLIVLNLCSITSTLNYLVNTVIDTGLDLSSSGILKIAGALVQVNGNLLCNGQIQLLSGVLVVDGNLSVLTGCKISVSGVSSINVTGPVLLPQIEFNYLLDSSSNPLSTLTWVGSNISMEVSALTVASNVVSKMEFVTPNALVSLKKSASAAAGAIAKLGSAVFKLASSLSVIGLSFGVVLIDSCVPPIVNVPLIDSLSIFNTSITTGLQGTFTQLNLTQSNVLFNQNAVVTTLLSTNSIVNIVNGASTVIGQVTISQSSLMSGLTGTVSAVSLLTASTLNLGTQATIATLSLAGSSILNTAPFGRTDKVAWRTCHQRRLAADRQAAASYRLADSRCQVAARRLGYFKVVQLEPVDP
ncbi:hypothetical protein DFA_05206 [Cavenderia fasciculata]|uniref:Uncharacterized protein n=1 Tax=Cavenderia fasciculata TaxID=261658 RepID=F4PNM3_CACFS|nr:uncharacterized protein DFA_05206 [Cavenderia fasciculata]EGG23076.1 hypothetical protein DFA_05206 [Cavenderia fasciculata]|eukprot:XP_004360927.1 hypothetical protein DFA_05206 [Cavenderia fasciculata]